MEAAALSAQIRSDVYQPLHTARKEIRLVTILPLTDPDSTIFCSIETVSLHDNPDYEALSYCWGDSSITKRALLDGHEIDITTNLYHALAQFQSETISSRLWVDAICINQSDFDERSEQVARMRDIFEAATNVRIWLGPSSPFTEREFELIERLLHGDLLSSRPTIWNSAKEYYQQTSDVASVWHDMVRFLRAPYWHRTWTMQERLTASRITLQCGSFAIDVQGIVRFIAKVARFFLYCTEQLRALAMQERQPYPPERFERLEDFKTESRTFIPIIGTHVQHEFNPEDVRSLPSLLAYIGRTEVTDARDHVYGTLGLFPRLHIIPDYSKPLEEVFADFTLRLMETGASLTSLYHPSPPDSSLPSWIPDLCSQVPPTTLYPFEGWIKTEDLFNASLKTTFRFSRLEHESLTVPALILDRIALMPARYEDIHPETTPLFNGHDDNLDTAYLKARCLGTAPSNTQGSLRRCSELDMRAYNVLWRVLNKGWTLPDELSHYFRHFDNFVGAQAMFYTEDGIFGSAQLPIPFRAGDYIAILTSLKLPLVLRRMEGQKAYKVIGPCYLNGKLGRCSHMNDLMTFQRYHVW